MRIVYFYFQIGLWLVIINKFKDASENSFSYEKASRDSHSRFCQWRAEETSFKLVNHFGNRALHRNIFIHLHSYRALHVLLAAQSTWKTLLFWAIQNYTVMIILTLKFSTCLGIVLCIGTFSFTFTVVGLYMSCLLPNQHGKLCYFEPYRTILWLIIITLSFSTCLGIILCIRTFSFTFTVFGLYMSCLLPNHPVKLCYFEQYRTILWW